MALDISPMFGAHIGKHCSLTFTDKKMNRTAPMEQSSSNVLPVTVDNNPNSDPPPRNKRTLVGWYVLAGVALVALVGIGAVVAYAVLRQTSKKNKNPTGTTTTTKRQQEISAMIHSIANNPAALAMASSPQSQAHAWLTRDDDIWADESIVVTMAMVTQRYALAVVHFATHGPSSWVAQTGWLDGHECSAAWMGVSCNRLEQVHTLVLGTFSTCAHCSLSLDKTMQVLSLSRARVCLFCSGHGFVA
jgi:hypothetical protein